MTRLANNKASPVITAVRIYMEQGLSPVPIAPRSKKPVSADWQNLVVRDDNVPKNFRGDRNVGLILGERSGGLCDFDLDCNEAIALASKFLPPTDAVFGRKSKPDSHHLYLSDLHQTETGARLVCRDGGETLLELRIGAQPAQTVVPPSVHESGEAIEWSTGMSGVPDQVPGQDLKQAFQRLAAATLLARHWDEGTRNDLANAFSGWVARLGWPEDEAVNFIEVVAVAAGDDEYKSRKRAVRDTFRKAAANKKTTGLVTLAKLVGQPVADACAELLRPESAADGFPDITKAGTRRATLENTKHALELMNIECGYDMFKLLHVVNGQAIHEFAGQVSDHVIHELRSMIRERFGFETSKQHVLDAVQTLSNHHRFHPVRDYLDNLVWDGTPRIDRWLITYGGAADTEFVRAVCALTLIAAVRRVRSPGCKFDEMLILEGEQGANKSRALAILAVKAEWFSDQLPLGLRGREAIEQTSGLWIIEVAEMQGMHKAESERVKAWLSSSSDRGRLAYGMTVTEAPRQFIPIGTTNSQSYLRDLTGNRRFWPVAVERFDLDALERDRDQLWAEAAAREAAGASIRLDPALWGAARGEQQDRMVENPFLAVLDRALRETDEQASDGLGPLMQGKILVDDLWTLLGVRPAQRHQGLAEQLADAMQELGWKKSRLRIEGGRSYVYVRGPEPHRQIVVLPPNEDGIPLQASYRRTDGPSY